MFSLLDTSAPRKFYLRIVRRFFFNGRDRGGAEPARAQERERQIEMLEGMTAGP